jgi:SAM-dependent methyltransferase
MHGGPRRVPAPCMPDGSPSAAVWRAVADLTGIGARTTVLDIGCGSGGFCALAAARGAKVAGIDVDADAVESARRLAPTAEIRLGLMEDLPWRDGAFDVVTTFNAVQYALDIGLALEEAARVTRSGGRIAVCKWDSPGENEFFAFLAELGGTPLDEHRLPARDPVEAAMARVGLETSITGAVDADIALRDEEHLLAALGSAGAALDADERRRALVAAVPYRHPGGGYRFRNFFRYRIAVV